MKANFIRNLVRGKPAEFQGTQREYSRLIMSLLDPPDHRRPWVREKVKSKKGTREVWVRVEMA